MDIITSKLFELKDNEYRDYVARIIPNLNKYKIIGVKTNDIKKLASIIKQERYTYSFLKRISHKYHEEYLLHAIILNDKYKTVDILLNKLDEFLIYVNDWQVVDIIKPEIFKRHPRKVYKYIIRWINSNREYKMRFAVNTLINFYLKDHYNKKIFYLVKNIKCNYYYVNTAMVCFYSTALIDYWDDAIKIFENKELNKWIQNRSLRKARISLRISEEKKEYLKKLMI